MGSDPCARWAGKRNHDDLGPDQLCIRNWEASSRSVDATARTVPAKGCGVRRRNRLERGQPKVVGSLRRAPDRRSAHRPPDSEMAEGGLLEDWVVTVSDKGTGQGSMISPLLANVYLHYVFDLWADRWQRREATGDVIIMTARRGGGYVKSTRSSLAAQEMKAGPSDPDCRIKVQTTASCAGTMAGVVSVASLPMREGRNRVANKSRPSCSRVSLVRSCSRYRCPPRQSRLVDHLQAHGRPVLHRTRYPGYRFPR